MSSVRNPSHPAGCTCLGCITPYVKPIPYVPEPVGAPYPPEAAGTTGVRTMEDRAEHGQTRIGGICKCGARFYAAADFGDHLRAHGVSPVPVDAPTPQRLPQDAAARKAVPLATGCLDYFPDALAAVAAVSKIGNEQHNPGKPLFWDRTKSTDEADCLLRHFVDRGTLDTDGVRHSAKVAWRALALLQKEIENER